MMKKILVGLVLLTASTTSVFAQSVEQKVNDWKNEVNLDTIDQENLPKKVTMGLYLAANMSNFIVTQANQQVSSKMSFGCDVAGILDFLVTEHFAIQGRLVFTAEENYVKGLDRKSQLWSLGMDVPVYFMGRYGNMKQGYLSFGAGPFTHFTFASNVNAYTNNSAVEEKTPIRQTETPTKDYSDLYKLHNNHSGVAATVSYEFPIGVQIIFNYQVSLSDIITYYHEQGGIRAVNASLYPQRLSLGVGYRFKAETKRKTKKVIEEE